MARPDKTQPGNFICPCCLQTEDQHDWIVTYDQANLTAYTGKLPPPKKRGFGFPIWNPTLKAIPPQG
jgi:hypothetical protein